MLHIDQLGRSVSIPVFPERIISLVPSQTELLFDLGLDDRVVGITKFCVHPASWFLDKDRVGGTKDFKVNRIEALRPDLIIANKEENDQEKIQILSQQFPVWVSDVSNLADALDMILEIGKITGTEAEAQKLATKINHKFSLLKPPSGKSAAYLIWKDPLMIAAKGTFVDSMLNEMGLRNVFSDETRYPEVTIDALIEKAPDFLFLSSEPFPFKNKHKEQFEDLLPKTKVFLVDGEAFSWYGSRLLKSPDYFDSLWIKISST